MQKIKFCNGEVFPIKDYATSNSFSIILNSLSAQDILEILTEENLSEIQFMTDSGVVTGVYHDKLLCGHVVNEEVLEVRINDADLVRHGLVLDENNRIVSAPAQRYAPANTIIVDDLPEGNLYDYLYIDGEYIYDPLPAPEQPDPQPTQEERITALEAALTAIEEGIASV